MMSRNKQLGIRQLVGSYELLFLFNAHVPANLSIKIIDTCQKYQRQLILAESRVCFDFYFTVVKRRVLLDYVNHRAELFGKADYLVVLCFFK